MKPTVQSPRHVVGRILAPCGQTSSIVATDFEGWIDAVPLDGLIERIWNGDTYLVSTCTKHSMRLRVFSDGNSVTLQCDADITPGDAIKHLPVLVLSGEAEKKHFKPARAFHNHESVGLIHPTKSRQWSPQNEFS